MARRKKTIWEKEYGTGAVMYWIGDDDRPDAACTVHVVRERTGHETLKLVYSYVNGNGARCADHADFYKNLDILTDEQRKRIWGDALEEAYWFVEARS